MENKMERVFILVAMEKVEEESGKKAEESNGIKDLKLLKSDIEL